ncbi:MAG: murein biosynthesis integral membrane protein MurJ [Proteobacteria bacterium]|nr:murein biosynthesis integral membrane protein MurJ [Pseudomonadota bacterium]
MKGGFLRSTSIVGAMTFVSRLTGVVRETIYAALMGASPAFDAFLVAFRIPNFLRRITAEGAFSQAFVPVVSEYRLKREPAEVQALVAGVMGTLGTMLLAVTAIGVIAAPLVIYLFAPGFDQAGDRHELAVHMLRWTFPYIFFISLTALGSGVLNSYGKFGTAAFNPVILNLVMIVFAAFVAPHAAQPVIALAIGVFVAGIIQLVGQFRGLARIGQLTWPRWAWSDPGVRHVGRLMLPGIFGSSVAQVSILLDSWIGSLLKSGSISWNYYADRLVEFPMGVFSIALATVILPRLSAHHAEETPEHFNSTLDWGLRLTCLVSAPAAVGLFMLAGPLNATLYGYGRFGAQDVWMTSYPLMSYAGGLMGFSLVKVLAPGYFARQVVGPAVRAGVISLMVTMAFNVLVVYPASRLGVPAPHALLALSTGLGAYVNTWLLYRGLRRSGVYTPSPQWRRLLLQALVANLAMAVFLWWAGGHWADWITWRAVARVGRLAACVLGGGAVYAAVLWLAGLRVRDLRAV